jgi:hypothetical protein
VQFQDAIKESLKLFFSTMEKENLELKQRIKELEAALIRGLFFPNL